MVQGTKASGKRVKLVGLEDSSMPTVTVMRAYGVKVKHVDRESMCTLMEVDTSGSSTQTIRTGLEGKSGRMEPYSKDSF